MIHPDQKLQDLVTIFTERASTYYYDVFLRIQRNTLSKFHVNWAALIGSFFWSALRASWLLFWIGFCIDLFAAVNIALSYKYALATTDSILNNRSTLAELYNLKSVVHLWIGLSALFLGRPVFAWLADRLYYRQYNSWRIHQETGHGYRLNRLATAVLVVILIAPLTLYRATQFAPEVTTCAKQDRALASQEQVAFKDRFDCLFIGDFPTLFRLPRPDTITFPVNDDGSRRIERQAASPDLPSVTLNVYLSKHIDVGIGYLTAFYGGFFDLVTALLRTTLEWINAVFVGTPWLVAMGAILFVSYILLGARASIFTGSTLAYLAVLGFWQPAMETLALVATSTLICFTWGLPIGIYVAKSRRAETIVTPILDVMQTIPSFVYLLPAIAFFSIGKPPGMIATIIFAMPPMIRLTALGIKQVPEITKEAALAFGATPYQLLIKVELPLSLPSIMTGINQVVMMSLSMVVVAALIGAGGMGFIVTEALSNAATGRGILAGIGIALLAMMIDRLIQRREFNSQQ